MLTFGTVAMSANCRHRHGDETPGPGSAGEATVPNVDIRHRGPGSAGEATVPNVDIRHRGQGWAGKPTVQYAAFVQEGYGGAHTWRRLKTREVAAHRQEECSCARPTNLRSSILTESRRTRSEREQKVKLSQSSVRSNF